MKILCFLHTSLDFKIITEPNQALTSITEKIRKALDEGKFACGVFLDFQKAFDTMDHDILLSKLEHYGVRGVPSEAT